MPSMHAAASHPKRLALNHRLRPHAWTLAVVVIASALGFSDPAVANHTPAAGDRSWTGCSWTHRAATSPTITVGVAFANAFPPDNVSPDGHAQSFYNRLSEVTTRWGAELGASAHGMSMTYVGRQPADVMVNYQMDVPDAEALGSTRIRRRIDPIAGNHVGSCPPQVSSNTGVLGVELGAIFDIIGAEIFIQRLDTWFTQHDSRRGWWETNCNPLTVALNPPATTCTKPFDFGSTMAHELGHTLVLRHPYDVAGGTAAAHCSDIPWRATMCGGPQAFRSERRTLETYDIQTLRTHQASN